ncbi:MAG: hypothetical protein HY695_34445 [Deltaproteobacteria bacterium]|nr:hypothetical protein [Deltaproteobacteria bacterium]
MPHPVIHVAMKTRWVHVFVVLAVTVFILAACSEGTRYKALSFLFDNPPKPGEGWKLLNERAPRPERRKAALKKAGPESVAADEKQKKAVEKLRQFEQVAAILPKDAAGGIDWAKALQEEKIAPRAGLDPEAKAQPILPLDVELVPAGFPLFGVTFSHATHTTWLTCASCHPEIFQMSKGADPITMDKIFAGQFCGQCHGKVAFRVETGCIRCHARMAEALPKRPAGPPIPLRRLKQWGDLVRELPRHQTGGIDWVKAIEEGTVAPKPSLDPSVRDQPPLALDLELTPPEHPMFKAAFSHAAHTAWLSCSNCHPGIFALKRGADKITMAKIYAGESCGACHGRVSFGVERECSRCHTKIPATAEWRPAEEPKNPLERAKGWEEAAKLLPVTAGTTDWVKALNEKVIAPRPGIDPKAADQPVLPLDVERVPTAGQMFKVIFPHKSHTEWLACPNCHTAIFQMAKGTTPMTMEKINAGQYCGVCHGKVAFPATACGRCHPAMAGGK